MLRLIHINIMYDFTHSSLTCLHYYNLFHSHNPNYPIYTSHNLIMLIHYHLHLMLSFAHLYTNYYYSCPHSHLVLLYLLPMILHSSIHYIFINYLAPLLSNNMFIALTLYSMSNLLLFLFHSVLLFHMYCYYISASRIMKTLNIMRCFMHSNLMLASYCSSSPHPLDYLMLAFMVTPYLYSLSYLI